jgi:hypothetical protein
MRRPLTIGAIMVIAILLIVAGWSALTSDEPDATTRTAAALTTSSTTTTSSPTTTTSSSTTTTTSTPTTIPGPELGSFVVGYGFTDFGATPDEVQTALEPLFGMPSLDIGWMFEPLCPGTEFRFLQYGDRLFEFRVLFTDAELFETGDEQFFSYNYNGDLEVPVSPPDLTVGTRLAEFRRWTQRYIRSRIRSSLEELCISSRATPTSRACSVE